MERAGATQRVSSVSVEELDPPFGRPLSRQGSLRSVEGEVTAAEPPLRKPVSLSCQGSLGAMERAGVTQRVSSVSVEELDPPFGRPLSRQGSLRSVEGRDTTDGSFSGELVATAAEPSRAVGGGFVVDVRPSSGRPESEERSSSGLAAGLASGPRRRM
jgi:hypothetical protein